MSATGVPEAEVVETLRTLLPGERILHGEGRRPWAVGGVLPAAVAVPPTVEAAAEVLGRAAEEGWKVVPAGAGSWIDGGGPCGAVDLVVSTRGLDRILQYEAADLTVTAEAGIPLAELDRRTGEHRQWLPLDPPGARKGTLGAVLATGLAGPLEAQFGRPRDQVLGLTLVTGDGRVLRLGGRVVKNVAGFDLVRLAVGSWGTLGLIAEATLRLYPEPSSDTTLALSATGRDALARAARAVATDPVAPAALELWLPGEGGREVGARPGGGALPGRDALGAPLLLIRSIGSVEAVESVLSRVRSVAGGHGATEAFRWDDDESRELHAALAEVEEPGDVVVRMSARPDRLGDVLDLAGRFGPRALTAAHVAAGVVRVVAAEEAVEGRAGLERILTDLRGGMEALDGTLTVLRAPPEVARTVGPWSGAGGAGALSRSIRGRFDPRGTLSPGKFVA